MASGARAGEELWSASGQADHQILIREHAGWDHNCDAVAYPAVRLDEAPRHGSVCAQIENIKIRSMYYGTQSQCIGREVRGLRLIYRAHAGYAGTDGIRYSVQYPSGLRSVSVTVTVTPDQPAARGATPSRIAEPVIAEPMPDAPQPPGSVPACAAVLS